MIFLRIGHSGPKIVSLQILLNRHTPVIALDVDGIFGPKTKNGVIAFQKHYHLGVDGVVGKETWGKLRQLSRTETVDVVDMTNNDAGDAITNIKSAGGDPIVLRGMSNGVGQAMVNISQKAKTPRSIVLLRFFGHGDAGAMNVSAGVDDHDADLAGISNANLKQIQGSLARIRPQLAAFSSIEFHGCQVGKGTSGRHLLRKLADVWQVPLTAALRDQDDGPTPRYTFRYEGPVFTAYPGGASLRVWSRKVAHHGAQKIQPSKSSFF